MEDFNITEETIMQEPQKQPEEPKPKKAKNPMTKRVLSGAAILALGFGSGVGGAYCYNALNDDSTPVIQTSTATPTSAKTSSGFTYTQIAEKTMDSVVAIQTESKTTGSFMQDYITEGAGSGVIISKDGYIVTNHHVIDGASKVTVTLKNGKTYNAKYVGSDEQSDLAVIKIDADDLTPAVLGDSDQLSVGDTAVAIGNPLGTLGGTFTTGVISALDRELTIDGETMTLMQTNAAINPGNSGGGLFDANGNLIGIVNAKSSGESIEGLGFAIPINDAKTVIEELLENGYVTTRAKLGVSMVDVEDEMTAMRYGVSSLGVYIAQVENGTAADEAGLKVGDQIIQMDGEEIDSASEAKKIIHAHKAGDQLKMIVKRDGKEMTITLTLGNSGNTDTNQF